MRQADQGCDRCDTRRDSKGMQQMVIINKNDVHFPEVKKLMADAGWTVIHDDDMPHGWVAYVDVDKQEVVTVNMWSKDQRLWLVK